MAQRYGKSQIFGCDISPIQPAYVWDNVFFSADDFEEDWTDYPENAFDYIHMRYTAFSIKDPAALLQRVMRYDPHPTLLSPWEIYAYKCEEETEEIRRESGMENRMLTTLPLQTPQARRVRRIPRDDLLATVRRQHPDRHDPLCLPRLLLLRADGHRRPGAGPAHDQPAAPGAPRRRLRRRH